jgi:hypothetical protein
MEMYRHAIASSRSSRPAADRETSVFAEWKRCEAVLAGDIATMSMPTFEGAITRWISLDRGSSETVGAYA